MTLYAAGTTIAVEKTRMEIEQLVTRYGATAFVSGWQNSAAMIVFEVHGRRVRFILPMPSGTDAPKRSRPRDSAEVADWIKQETRRRWRCLLLSIKSKLESVATGIESFESEFLAHFVIPSSGETVGEWVGPQLKQLYDCGKPLPPMLGT
jgi:hypothetical protein